MSLDKRKIKISELLDHATSMDEFQLKHRFTEEEHHILSEDQLSKIHPLNELGETKLYDLLDRLQIRKGYKLNDEYFTSIIDLKMKIKPEKEIRQWLDDLLIKPETKIMLVWDYFGAVITEWSIFKKNYQEFFYPVSDDLTIIDESLSWSLYLFHEEIMYYGRNDDIFLDQAIKLI